MKKFFSLFLLLFLPFGAYSDDTLNSQLGIFDCTTEWIAAQAFPKKGVSGRAEYSDSEIGPVYDLYAYANVTRNGTDEGFYLYTPKSGSWTLTAKVEWLNRWSRRIQAKCGLMICEDSESAKEPAFFRIENRIGGRRPPGAGSDKTLREDLLHLNRVMIGERECLLPNSIMTWGKENNPVKVLLLLETGVFPVKAEIMLAIKDSQGKALAVRGIKTVWRSAQSEEFADDPDGRQRFQPGFQRQSLYMRISRYANCNLLISEWSEDGEKWFESQRETIVMTGPVQFGLFISNLEDREQSVHAQFSEVKMEPALPKAARLLGQDYYHPNQKIPVHLEIVNPDPEPKLLTVSEILPDGWKAQEIRPQGEQHGEIITWKISAPPGSSLLSYSCMPSSDVTEEIQIQGSIGSIPITGRILCFSA